MERKKVKLCYLNTDSFIAYIKTEHINVSSSKYVETRLDTSNYELDRQLPKGKNKKVIGLMRDELGGKTVKEFPALTARTYSYLQEQLR